MKTFGSPRHAEARVDALLAFVDEREVAAFDVVDAVLGARRGRDVAGFDDGRAGAAAAARRGRASPPAAAARAAGRQHDGASRAICAKSRVARAVSSFEDAQRLRTCAHC